jgi:hypothetical protein
MKELKEAITDSRDNDRLANSDKEQFRDDASISSAANSSLDKLRGKYKIDKDAGASPGYKEAESMENLRVSDSLNRLRGDMGLDDPNAPVSFNLDELPDLGSSRGSRVTNSTRSTAGTRRTAGSTTGSTTGSAAGRTSVSGGTNTLPSQNRNRTSNNRSSAQMKASIKSQLKDRGN